MSDVQEPVAWGMLGKRTDRIIEVSFYGIELLKHDDRVVPLYTTPQRDKLVREAAEKALGGLEKVYELLNSYANKDDLAMSGATSPHGVLAQVYGDLAPGFHALRTALSEEEA